MKRSQLREIVLEAMRGYSPQIGQTKGGTTDDFRNILTAIAKQRPEEEDSEEESARRGHASLDKANPENVARILRGEKPIYEAKEKTNLYSKAPIQDLLEATIWDTGEISLSIYSTKGDLKRRNPSVPLEAFTQEYVEKQVSTFYNLSDNFKQGITQFISDVNSLVSSND